MHAQHVVLVVGVGDGVGLDAAGALHGVVGHVQPGLPVGHVQGREGAGHEGEVDGVAVVGVALPQETL